MESYNTASSQAKPRFSLNFQRWFYNSLRPSSKNGCYRGYLNVSLCNGNGPPNRCRRFVLCGNLVHYWCRSLMLLLLIWHWSKLNTVSSYRAGRCFNFIRPRCWCCFNDFSWPLKVLHFSTRSNWRQGLGLVLGVEHCFLLQFAHALSCTQVIYVRPLWVQLGVE